MGVLVAEVVDGEVPAAAEVLLDAGGPLVDDGVWMWRGTRMKSVVGGEGGGRVGREDSGKGLPPG